MANILITDYELSKFQALYNDKKQPNNKISFTDLCSIITNLNQIASSVKQTFIESIRKELKAKMNIDNEAGIMVNQPDYFKYINILIIENNRYINQRDPEMQELFALLTGGTETITKKNLMEILMTYDMPIESDSFFAYVSKKEELAFGDFCALFKPDEKNELFMRTFAKSFNVTDNSNDNVFPIHVSKRV